MKTRHLQDGFTLMEIILVMIVGAGLLFAGSQLYNALRENAGAANANARAISLQQLVERLATENGGTLPSADSLRAEWARVRNDANASPWGGQATWPATDASVSAAIREIYTCDTSSGGTRCFDGGQTSDVGVMVYIHYPNEDFDAASDSGAKRGHWKFPYIDTYDHAQKAYVRTSKFAVAVENPNGKQFYFVHGPSYVDPQGSTVMTSLTKGLANGPSGSECTCSKIDLAGLIGDPSSINFQH